MSSVLPSGESRDRAVDTFGIGTYDDSGSYSAHGEDSEPLDEEGRSLPDDGGSLDPFGPDRLLSYPQTTYGSMDYETGDVAVSMLPADEDRPPSGRKPEDSIVRSDVLPTVSQSELPSDHDNPSARSDYYDHLNISQALSDIWPSGDGGAYGVYAQTGEESLPNLPSNDAKMDDFLSALGNAWSGYVVEDQTVPEGFPTPDLQETVNYPEYAGPAGGTIVALQKSLQNRTATNVQLVSELTKKFLTKFGKKDLTRRHVMSFLQELGQPQFMASDIVRCMKLSHEVYVNDVLDEFPIFHKSASSPAVKISSVRQQIISLEIQNAFRPEVANPLRRCAADLAHVMADLERMGVIDV